MNVNRSKQTKLSDTETAVILLMFAAILRKDSRMSFLLKLLEIGTISITTTSDSKSTKEEDGEVLKGVIS